MHFSFELFKVAFSNLSRQGLRSYLTLIGIVIGIAAIVTIISLGNGLNNAITKQFEQLGSNTIFVFPSSSSQRIASTSIKTLKDSDIKKIKGLPEVSGTVAPVFSNALIEFSREKKKIPVIGIDFEEAEIMINSGFAEIGEGRSITKNDGFVAVIGNEIAEKFFEKKIRLRQKILIEGKAYRVIGITKKNAQVIGDAVNPNNTIFISKKAYSQTFAESDPFFMIVKVNKKENVEKAREKIEKIFEKTYGKNQKEFNVNSSEQLLERINQILGLVQLFLVGIAAVSLLVGSIGIMNTMIMTVMERTKEIGVMKAIGATNSLVLSMFLLEAGFIGLIGGIIGTAIGYLLAFAVQAVAGTMGFSLIVQIDFALIAGALLFAMLVGMISGFYPARRAALLDPVEALRGAE